MNQITKLTTLALIGTLAVGGAVAGVREADAIPVDELLQTQGREIVKRTYRYAERASRKAAYDRYREDLRLEDVEGFRSYVRSTTDWSRDGMSTRKRSPHAWERSYEMYERNARQDALVAARKVFAKGMAEVKQVARQLARREAEREMPRHDFRMRLTATYRNIVAELGLEKAKALAAQAVERAREEWIARAAEKYEAQLAATVADEAMKAGYEEYAKLEEEAYLRGKFYFNRLIPMSAPAPEVEDEEEAEERDADEVAEPREDELIEELKQDATQTADVLAHGGTSESFWDSSVEAYDEAWELGRQALRTTGKVAKVGAHAASSIARLGRPARQEVIEAREQGRTGFEAEPPSYFSRFAGVFGFGAGE